MPGQNISVLVCSACSWLFLVSTQSTDALHRVPLPPCQQCMHAPRLAASFVARRVCCPLPAAAAAFWGPIDLSCATAAPSRRYISNGRPFLFVYHQATRRMRCPSPLQRRCVCVSVCLCVRVCVLSLSPCLATGSLGCGNGPCVPTARVLRCCGDEAWGCVWCCRCVCSIDDGTCSAAMSQELGSRLLLFKGDSASRGGCSCALLAWRHFLASSGPGPWCRLRLGLVGLL